MPIRTADDVIVLEGNCSVEEAETLHELLRTLHEPVLDLSGAQHLHTAIVQLIMVSKAEVRGLKPDPVLAACLRSGAGASPP